MQHKVGERSREAFGFYLNLEEMMVVIPSPAYDSHVKKSTLM